MTEKPTLRALNIFQTVAAHGPVPLSELESLHTDISRAGIWRALNNLRDAGWVRMRMGDSAWLITHAAQDALQGVKRLPRAVGELAMRLPPPSKGQDTFICTFTDYGKLEVVESSDKDLLGDIIPLIGQAIAFSALGISEEADMLRHLKAWVETTPDPEERALVKRGGLTQGIRAARLNPSLRTSTGYTVPHRAQDNSIAVAWIGTQEGDRT